MPGRVLTTAYDGANRTVQGNGQVNGVNIAYVSKISYWPHGATYKSWYGNQLAHTNWSFNSRLQPAQMWDAFQDSPNFFVFKHEPTIGRATSATTTVHNLPVTLNTDHRGQVARNRVHPVRL